MRALGQVASPSGPITGYAALGYQGSKSNRQKIKQAEEHKDF